MASSAELVRRPVHHALCSVAVALTVAGLSAASADAAASAPASAADAIERSAWRLSKRTRALSERRPLARAAADLGRSLRAGDAATRAYPAGPRRGAAEKALKRARLGLARATSAGRLARRGQRARARHHARLARRRLAVPLTALRALCCLPSPAPPPAPAPAAPTPAAGCPAALPESFRTGGYAILPIPLEQQPYRRPRPMRLDQPVNEDGSLRWEKDGVDHPHPTALENHSLAMAESYRLDGDPEYLRRAIGSAEKLLAYAVPSGDGLYLAYTFPFDVFGDPADHLVPPWFSGMAQGRALVMFERLYEATGDEHWREAERRIYATTFHPRCAGRPWSAFVDDDGYLWFEEYPGTREPTRVLNGHISALSGYWEHARATGDPVAARLFDGGAATALHYARVLRRPGEYSAYSVHTPVQNAFYHGVHVDQLRQLAVLTGDDAFAELADRFEEDGQAAAGS